MQEYPYCRRVRLHEVLEVFQQVLVKQLGECLGKKTTKCVFCITAIQVLTTCNSVSSQPKPASTPSLSLPWIYLVALKFSYFLAWLLFCRLCCSYSRRLQVLDLHTTMSKTSKQCLDHLAFCKTGTTCHCKINWRTNVDENISLRAQ